MAQKEKFNIVPWQLKFEAADLGIAKEIGAIGNVFNIESSLENLALQIDNKSFWVQFDDGQFIPYLTKATTFQQLRIVGTRGEYFTKIRIKLTNDKFVATAPDWAFPVFMFGTIAADVVTLRDSIL